MAIYVNGVNLENVNVNGVQLDNVYCNGVLVWQNWKEYTSQIHNATASKTTVVAQQGFEWNSGTSTKLSYGVIPMEIKLWGSIRCDDGGSGHNISLQIDGYDGTSWETLKSDTLHVPANTVWSKTADNTPLVYTFNTNKQYYQFRYLFCVKNVPSYLYGAVTKYKKKGSE